MTTYRLWPSTNGPGAQTSDAANYTLGVEFYVTQSGCTLTDVHFWASGTVSGSDHALKVWKVDSNGVVPLVSDPNPVATGTFTSPLTSGWNTVTLGSPVSLVANQHYRAGVYFTTDNGYTSTAGYWNSGAGSADITNGPLTAPSTANALANKQGSFTGVPGDFPAGSFNGGNYWIDVTVDDNVSGGGSVSGTVAAPLGALTASVTGTHGAVGTVAAPLGALTATVTGTRNTSGSIACSLGGLTATLTQQAAAVETAGSWGPLLALVREARRPPPIGQLLPDCPNDGTTLLPAPHGGRYCPFDGYRDRGV